jgi:hypothetical protein
VADPNRWHALPPIELPTPVLALLPPAPTGSDGPMWVGGVGGVVAWWPDGVGRRPGETPTAGEPEPVTVTLPLGMVSALCRVGGWVVAAGAEGIVRFREPEAQAGKVDDAAVEAADVQSGGAPVAALAVVPAASHLDPGADPDADTDGPVLLAATLGDGVLRSLDRGRTWTPAGFGLADPEVSALLVTADGRVLAGTQDGVFAATPGVRAWRRCAGSQGIAIADLTEVTAGVVAAGEDGTVLRSRDGGATFSPGAAVDGLLGPVCAAADGALVAGTAGAGIWRSTDGADSWTQVADSTLATTVYCLAGYRPAGHADQLYAGTLEGLATSVDGVNWRTLPPPVTGDLDRLLVGPGGRVVVAGGRSGLVELGADGTWGYADLAGEPFPLSGVTVTPDGTLLAADQTGLYRHVGPDAAEPGQSWTCVYEGEHGHVGAMAFRPEGFGLAASARHGDHLLRTTDGGATWQVVPAPFGVLAVRVLQVGPDVVLAATVDPRHEVVQLWASLDDGNTWQREARAETSWPLVFPVEDPPGLSLGRSLFRRDTGGGWSRWAELDDGIRAVTSGPTGGVIAGTASGIWLVAADGTPGERLGWGPPPGDVVDLQTCGRRLYVLTTGGQVYLRDLHEHPAGSAEELPDDHAASTKR